MDPNRSAGPIVATDVVVTSVFDGFIGGSGAFERVPTSRAAMVRSTGGDTMPLRRIYGHPSSIGPVIGAVVMNRSCSRGVSRKCPPVTAVYEEAFPSPHGEGSFIVGKAARAGETFDFACSPDSETPRLV
ncbi:MAG: hypothetical protein QHI48_10425 [Bacteroidota bacterium]|nr:hypothetical protein [Bacteroidota bacterium]